MSRENEILKHMDRIETLKKWMQTKEAAIKDGSKRTGKPLSASSIKGYTSQINVWSKLIKHSEAEIERLKNTPVCVQEGSMSEKKWACAICGAEVDSQGYGRLNSEEGADRFCVACYNMVTNFIDSRARIVRIRRRGGNTGVKVIRFPKVAASGKG